MDHELFFYRHPVFRYEEYEQWLSEQGQSHAQIVKNYLQYYQRKSRIKRLRHRIYAVVPPDESPENMAVDPYLVAAKAAGDSVLSYHTALEMHGVAYSIFNQFTYLTFHKAKAFDVGTYRFQPTSWPKTLQSESQSLGMVQMNRQGIDIWVTNLERTFVDVLDRVELAGGWEEVVRSILNIAVLDSSQVIDYCIKLGNARLVGKVGFYLQQKAKPFQPSEQQLKKLKQAKPKSPQYVSNQEEGPFEYIPEWNILLPRHVVHQYWEENSA